MTNRSTTILGATVVTVLVITIAVGMIASQPPAPKPQSAQTTQETPGQPKDLSRSELDKKLIGEQPAIDTAISDVLPTLHDLYTVHSERLYGQGEWYGAVLLYKGSDENNRDTLRLLLQKKQGVWTVRTTPPQILLSSVDLPDVPKSVLQDLNQPAPLPGTPTSPAIN